MNSLSMAFVANAQSNQLMFTSSFDGSTWTAYVPIPMASNSPPSLMINNGLLWMAYVAHDGWSVVVCSSPDGVNWTISWNYYRQFFIAPTLAVFNNKLWLTVVKIDNTVEMYSNSGDGLGWSGQPIGVMSNSSVGMTSFNNQLWMAFEAVDGKNSLVVCSSLDGLHWSSSTQVGQCSKTGPGLTVFNNQLWVAFVANNTTNALLVCSSPDGRNWSTYTRVGVSQFTPSLAGFNNRLWMAYVDSTATVMVSSSSDGVVWSGGTSVGQSSKFAPAILSNLPIFGRVPPRYKILTVVYAPPGVNNGQSSGQSNSQVVYSTGSTAGTSTSLSKSFQAGINVTAGVGVQAGVVSLGASSSFTASKSTTDTATLNVTKSEGYSIQIYGPGADGIDHGHDLFYLWLNPAVHVQSDHTGNVGWNLGTDGSTMLIQYVYASQLKDPSTMPPGVKSALQNAGLTDLDFAQILSTNPFANTPQAQIDTTRYVLTPQSFAYEPPLTATDPSTPVQTYTQQSAVAQDGTSTAEKDYAVSLSATAGVDVGVVSASVSVTGSFQWTDTSSHGSSSTSTQSASVSIGGPSFGYKGPTNILVYWDTLYSSFMFTFVPSAMLPSVTGSLVDANGAPVANRAVKVAVGGQTYQTVTGRDGQYRIYGAPTGEAKVTAGTTQMNVVVKSGEAVAPLRIA